MYSLRGQGGASGDGEEKGGKTWGALTIVGFWGYFWGSFGVFGAQTGSIGAIRYHTETAPQTTTPSCFTKRTFILSEMISFFEKQLKKNLAVRWII